MKGDLQVKDRVEDLIPQNGLMLNESISSIISDVYNSLRTRKLYLDSDDPLKIAEMPSYDDLDSNKRSVVNQYFNQDRISDRDLQRFVESMMREDQPEDWVEDLYYGSIDGVQTRFMKPKGYSGDYKIGYVGGDCQVFAQVPRKGDTFAEKLERVQTWKENKKVLDNAEDYIDRILEKEGEETVERGMELYVVDYDLLHENEDMLREEISGGILTPSEYYSVIITEHENQPVPVMLSEFNDSMKETDLRLDKHKEYGELVKRHKTLAMYIDALIAEDLFENAVEEYWYDRRNGKEGIKNMFYSPQKDKVGVTDIGEKRGKKPDQMPEISLPRIWL